MVPNLTLTTQPGFNAVSGGIRGTGSVSILVTEDPSVAFLVDDFGLNHVQSQFVEMFDIEQIEVYRGHDKLQFVQYRTFQQIETERDLIQNHQLGKPQKDLL